MKSPFLSRLAARLRAIPARQRRWALGIGAALLAVVGSLCFTFVVAGGQLCRRDARELDLRGESLTLAQYERLREKLPDCRIRWSIPIGAGRYDSAAGAVKISDLTTADVELFTLFEHLTYVDADGCADSGALLALRDALPDCRVHWTVALGGRRYDQDTKSVLLGPDTDYAQLAAGLSFLPALETVRTNGLSLTPEEQASLTAFYPDVLFLWPVALWGDSFPSGTRTLDLSGREGLTPLDLRALIENAHRFPRLETVDLTGCGFRNETLAALAKALPGVDVKWSFDLCGVTVCSLDREIDLSGQKIKDLSVVEDALPYLQYVEKLVMCRCGPSDEDMDALDRKYEDIRFVWAIRLGNNWIRTDETAFINTKLSLGKLQDWHTGALRYCTDMIALDLGHNFLSDISFVAYMPHLRYFIVAENPVRDYSPLAGLQELIYLELFQTSSMDLSPLLECPALEDLNICHIPAEGDAAFAVLSQMTWLKRLWYSGTRMTQAQQDALRQALPDCEMMLKRGQESTVDPWRISDNYYEMRDVFGMYYMDGYGDECARRTLDKQY